MNTLQKKKNPFRKNCQTKNPPDSDPEQQLAGKIWPKI
jgi:hypothetical protein